jgi:hypothetical protein
VDDRDRLGRVGHQLHRPDTSLVVAARVSNGLEGIREEGDTGVELRDHSEAGTDVEAAHAVIRGVRRPGELLCCGAALALGRRVGIALDDRGLDQRLEALHEMRPSANSATRASTNAACSTVSSRVARAT